MLNILFFARLREQLGQAAMTLEMPDTPCSVEDLTKLLIEQNPDWQNLLYDGSVLTSVNQQMVNGEHLLSDGDEIAYFPPVTGG